MATAPSARSQIVDLEATLKEALKKAGRRRITQIFDLEIQAYEVSFGKSYEIADELPDEAETMRFINCKQSEEQHDFFFRYEVTTGQRITREVTTKQGFKGSITVKSPTAALGASIEFDITTKNADELNKTEKKTIEQRLVRTVKGGSVEYYSALVYYTTINVPYNAVVVVDGMFEYRQRLPGFGGGGGYRRQRQKISRVLKRAEDRTFSINGEITAVNVKNTTIVEDQRDATKEDCASFEGLRMARMDIEGWQHEPEKPRKTADKDCRANVEITRFAEDGAIECRVEVDNCSNSGGDFEIECSYVVGEETRSEVRRLTWGYTLGEDYEYVDYDFNVQGGKLVDVRVRASSIRCFCNE